VLHVFEFRDGRISRENVWIDAAAAIAQLTSPDKSRTRRAIALHEQTRLAEPLQRRPHQSRRGLPSANRASDTAGSTAQACTLCMNDRSPGL
jgi:alpha-ketoglutarate-dependent taurine dioxygenase